MSELLGALEVKLAAAVGADRELEQDIWHALGLCQPVMINGTVAGCADYHAPRFTASIDAALTLVPEGWHWEATGAGYARVRKQWDDFKDFEGRAKTTPLAICLATIRARKLAEPLSTRHETGQPQSPPTTDKE